MRVSYSEAEMSGGGSPDDDTSEAASFPEISSVSAASGVCSRELGLSRRFKHDSWNQSYGKEIYDLRSHRVHGAYLAGETLYHSFSFLIRFVYPPAAAEGSPKILIVVVFRVFFLGILV